MNKRLLILQTLALSLVCILAVGCNSGTTPSATTQPMVYVTNSGSDNVSMYSIDTGTGWLTPLNPPTVAAQTQPRGIVTPSLVNQFTYVLNSGSISMYQVNGNGVLSPLSESATPITIATPGQLSIIAADLYNIYLTNSQAETLSAYSIALDGSLVLNSTVATCSHPSGIGIRNNEFVYVLCSTGPIDNPIPIGISIYSLVNNSTLIPAVESFESTPYYPSQILVNSSSNYVYVLSRDMNAIFMYSIAANGSLTPLATESIPTGNTPTAISFDSQGSFVYVTNFADNTISIYSINSANGILTPYTAESTIATESGPQRIAVYSASGSTDYIYVTNTTSNSISIYYKNSNGMLTPVTNSNLNTVATESEPFGIQVINTTRP